MEESVWLKLRPYRQTSVAQHSNNKLAPRHFGPFEIEAKFGSVAYKLKIPEGSRIHPVFHVSKLNKAIRMHPLSVTPVIFEESDKGIPPRPEQLIRRRRTASGDQVLIKWHNGPKDEATWEDVVTLKGQFPNFDLEDKVEVEGESNVRTSFIKPSAIW